MDNDKLGLDELERATGALIMLFLDGDNEGEHGGDHHDEDCPVCKVIADAQAALITAARRPDDMVLVPREPTREMLHAGATDDTPRTATNSLDRMYETVSLIYRAMLSAAPKEGE